MNKRVQAFLQHFDSKIQTEIINFCNRISNLEADVYILMARKSACFFNCLEELGVIHFNGYVTSERILDMDCWWLNGKSVVIIDDSIVSGTTLHTTINALIKHNVSSIDVHVLTINDRWYMPELLKREEGGSYLYPVYNKLPDSQCIKLCNDIVRSISCTPRPYDIDFPYYNEIIVRKDTLHKLIHNVGWEMYDISSYEQQSHGVMSLTLIPNDEVMFDFCAGFGLDQSLFCLRKIRLYCRHSAKRKERYHIRLVPMLIFDELPLGTVTALFDDLAGNNQDLNVRMNDKAKLRLLQFYISDQFAKYWFHDIRDYLDLKDNLYFEARNLTFLFPNQLVYPMSKLCESAIVFSPIVYCPPPMSCEDQPAGLLNQSLKNADDKDSEDEDENSDHNTNHVSVDYILIEPFLKMYYDKEIPCRTLVLAQGIKAFTNEQYERLVNRLNTGVSVNQLCRSIASLSRIYHIPTLVSIFIDKSIDAGIIVPITQMVDDMIFRSYRHGEDVLFSQREEMMYLSMLSHFQQYSNRPHLSRIMTEKLIVLFTEIGLREKFLTPYISNNHNIDQVLRIKTYLHGKVALVDSAIESTETKQKPYITTERKAKWFTSYFTQKRKLHVKKKSKEGQGGYYQATPIDTSALTDEDINKIQIFSQLMADVCNPQIDTGVTYKDSDLIKVTSSVQLKSVVRSIAAEVNIFRSEYYFENFPDNNNIACDYRNIRVFRNSMERMGLHSAYMKMNAYISGEAKQLIEAVKFSRVTDTSQWRIFFKEELSEDISGKNKFLLELFDQQRLWIYCTLLINSSLYYCLLYNFQLSYDLSDSKNKHYAAPAKDLKRVRGDVNAQKTQLEQFLANQPAADETAIRILTLVRRILDEAVNDKPIDNNTIRELIETNDNIQKTVDQMQDVVCCVLGSDGKINNVITYNNVLCVQYAMQDRERLEHIREKIKYCLDVKTNQIGKRQDSNIFPPPLALLSDSECPHVFTKGSGLHQVWFRATSEYGADLAALGLNIFYELFKYNIPARVVLITNMRYSESINSNDGDVTKYWCNNFINVIQYLRPYIFLDSIEQSEIVALTEKSAVKGSKPLQFLESKANHIYELISEEFLDNEQSDRVYRKGQYKIRHEQLADGGNLMHKDIAIITVLPEECLAVKTTYNLEEAEFEMGERLYYYGTVRGENTVHTVAMTQTVGQGPNSIISAYKSMMDKFSPSIVFVVGIAGGIDDKINLCDVVVPMEVFSYDLVKDTPDGIKHRGDSFKVNPQVIPVVQKMQQILMTKKLGGRNFTVLNDPIGSGSAVIANKLSQITQYLKTVNSKIAAVEMEASGICSAVYEDGVELKQPTYGVLNFRGISDLADENKPHTDNVRITAAENAAIVSLEFLQLLPKQKNKK